MFGSVKMAEENASLKFTIENALLENDTVFIVPHDNPDFDAIGSAVGLAILCKKYKKNVYIIINDTQDKIEYGARKVINEIKDKIKIITAADVTSLLTPKSLLITTDVNKEYLISVKDKLELFNDVLIIDHHKQDEKTIKRGKRFINDSSSSTCEIIAKLLNDFNIKINANYANYLLAGIILDTNKFSKNANPETFEIVYKLTKNGADTAIASNLFLEDFEHDRVIQKLVDSTNFFSFNIAIATDLHKRIYLPEDIAKTADYLLKYNINASFVLGYITDDIISISARSKGTIDVNEIMHCFGGGGNKYSAAAKVKYPSIEEVKNTLIKTITPGNMNINILESLSLNNIATSESENKQKTK
jgi:c-di-AMP phosphodiesterase-like protein